MEDLRENLIQTAMRHGDLLHPEVISKSQELDQLLTRLLREQLQLTRLTFPQSDSLPSTGRGRF
ncbi:Spo0E family sporulation regulatory protein-aspartic acid phosphatase [Effusibacillus dendaii]|uniref:Spo0E family sporulation regulatory protein-aspartic acid phosphatase n=1 Tax=Effusibacillus dendaii TaxID=2743772 RepID=UPI00190C6C5E